MEDVSRKDIYSFIAGLLSPLGTHIYRVGIPETLGEDDISDGFTVLKLGDIYDHSEVPLTTYCTARMTVCCYVPSVSTSDIGGIMNTSKFDAIQKQVDSIIMAETVKTGQKYGIGTDDVLSLDDFYSNGTNSFYLYVKSFIITVSE